MRVAIGVLLGTESHASSLDRLRELGVTHVLNATLDVEHHFPLDFIYCRLALRNDGSDAMDALYCEYEMGARFVRRAVRRGGSVLVFCATGLDASVTAVLAYLLFECEQLPLNKAYALLTLHEPCLRLSRSNALFLGVLELQLRGESSIAPPPRSEKKPRREKKQREKRKPIQTHDLFSPLLADVAKRLLASANEGATRQTSALRARHAKRERNTRLGLYALRAIALVPDLHSFWWGQPRRINRKIHVRSALDTITGADPRKQTDAT